MSAALVRLYRLATGTADRATPRAVPAAPAVADEPRIVSELRELLEARYGADCAPVIRRFVMRSRLAFHDAAYRPDTVLISDEEADRHLFEEGPVPAQLPLALAIERTAYDTTHMPVDVQLELRGLRPQFAGVNDDKSLSRDGERPVLLRDDVLHPQEQVHRTDGSRRSLLSSALVFSEPLSQTKFSSIEAIGFRSKFFFDHIVTRVPDQLAVRYQRLFWQRAGALSPGSSNKSLHAAASVPQGFYWVPASYKYTVLLISVHTYLAVQDLALDISALDPALYELPTAHNRVLFEYGALHAAVDFIDERLLGIHPRVYPRALSLAATPFAAVDWQAVVDERRAVSLAQFDADSASTPMELLVEHSVYYAFFNNAEEAPVLHTATSRSSTPGTDSEASYAGTPDDDDEDDEVSLEFKTPRSVNPTPRPSTLTGFLSAAVAAAAAADSATLTDYNNPQLRRSPVRPQPSPRLYLSPARAPPLPPPALLHQTPLRSVADVAGAAQSDDHSEVSPDTAVAAAAEQSSTSASIEARAVLTRAIVEKANQRLRSGAAH